MGKLPVSHFLLNHLLRSAQQADVLEYHLFLLLLFPCEEADRAPSRLLGILFCGLAIQFPDDQKGHHKETCTNNIEGKRVQDGRELLIV